MSIATRTPRPKNLKQVREVAGIEQHRKGRWLANTAGIAGLVILSPFMVLLY